MIIKKNNQKLGNRSEKALKVDASLESEIPNEVIVDKVEIEEIEEIKDEAPKEPEIDLFDIETIDFTQRQERRRGSRRRGYRRIDDRNLVSRAHEESENIKRSAFEEGYRMGMEKANADIEQFRSELSNFMNAKKDVFEYIAPDILEISVDIAKKIIKREIETDPQIIIESIVDVLKTISKNEPKITIRVRPQSVQFVKDVLPNLSYQYGIDAKISVVADPSIDDGGCVLETNNGIVDASVDTQLEIIKKALEGIG